MEQRNDVKKLREKLEAAELAVKCDKKTIKEL